MLRLELDPLPSPAAPPADVAVVVDALRMTTHAVELFDRGLAELLVVAEVDDARAVAAREGARLFGERGGLPPAGFDGGNSPRQHRDGELRGARAVLCTTNGSRAVAACAGARGVLLGGARNAAAVAAAALDRAGREVRLVCAGTGGRLSLDDVLAAACVLRALAGLEPRAELGDGARLALAALAGTPDLATALADCRHGRVLRGLGFGADIAHAAALDASRAAPLRCGPTGAGPARFRDAGEGRG